MARGPGIVGFAGLPGAGFLCSSPSVVRFARTELLVGMGAADTFLDLREFLHE